jgi:hypothetical protein
MRGVSSEAERVLGHGNRTAPSSEFARANRIESGFLGESAENIADLVAESEDNHENS